MKECGLKTKEKAKEDIFHLTEPNLMGIGKQINRLVRAVKTGPMGPIMMVITKMVLSMDMESSVGQTRVPMLGTFTSITYRVKGDIAGTTDAPIKEIGLLIRCTEKENSPGKMVAYTKETI